jgi:hypothetical protein
MRKRSQPKRDLRRVMADMTRADALDVARQRLKRLDGRTPAMSEISDMLPTAAAAEQERRAVTDALIVLARETGMTWHEIAGRIGTTRQGAYQRHARALNRIRVVGR